MKNNDPSNSRSSSRLAAILPSKPAIEWIAPTIVTLVTCAAFLPALWNQFVDWDDYDTLVNNLQIRGLGWSQLRWMFTTFHMGPYQPLSWVTYAIDYLIWGMNPVGYHLTNLIFHAANGVFLYFISRRLIALAFSLSDGRESWRLDVSAAFAALTFAVHPLRVESVAWATERRDVLSGFFYLWTIYCYLRAASVPEPREHRRWLGVAVAVYALSLLSKATAMTLPAVLVLLDIFPLRRLQARPWVWLRAEFRNTLWEKLPFLALATVFATVALLGQRAAGALQQYEFILRVAQALYALTFYLWKTLVPIHLSPLYEVPVLFSQWTWVFVLGGGGLIVMGIVLFFLGPRWPALLACWLYYVIVLIPISGIVPIGPQLVADRYSYLACLSWALLAGAGLLYFWQSLTSPDRSNRPIDVVAPALTVVTVLCLSFLTWVQIGAWRNSQALWKYVIAVGPNSSIANDALGKIIEREGDGGQALELYRRAVAINPGNAGAQYNLARLLARNGRVQDAVSHYRIALVINPDDAETHNNLGLLLAMQGETTEALEHLYKAAAIDPSDALAFFNLGQVFSLQGQVEKAVQNYRQAIKLDPNQVKTYLRLGDILEKHGHLEEAEEEFEAAVRLKPEFADAHVALARSLAAQGKTAAAEKHYRQALELLRSQNATPSEQRSSKD